jgi:hypothetical protein
MLADNGVTFLNNHREAIAAMDFFTVPTMTFGILYCFFVIAHDRRRILHFHEKSVRETCLRADSRSRRNILFNPTAPFSKGL